MLDSELQSVLADAASLIAIRTPNPPGNEGRAAAWLAERLRASASRLTLQRVSRGRKNLLATFDFGPGPTVVFCTHLDVVPVQSEDQWRAVIANGCLHGRGACDAKGILAALIAACERLAARNDLAGRLLLAAVADEESDATGALALLDAGLEADIVIIGEPTDNLVVLGSRGAMRLAVTFHGRAAHASSPSQGINAVYPAARFALAVQSMNEGLAERTTGGSCAATVVHGGSKLNIIPDVCTVQVDRRLALGETASRAVGEIESLAAAAVHNTSVTFETAPAGVWLDPFETAVSRPAIQGILRAVGQPHPAPAFAAGTDAPHFVARGIPAVILGPGSLSVAHSATESVEVTALAAAVDLYDRVARSLLLADQAP